MSSFLLAQMYFTDLSDTDTRYSSLSCAAYTSSIIVSSLLYFVESGVNCTHSTRFFIHLFWFAIRWSNDSIGPTGNSLIMINSAPNSEYITPPADAQTCT